MRPNSADWLHEAWLDKKQRRQLIIAWEIAQRLVEMGFAGIRVPSQAKGAMARDINIVFWRWTRVPPMMVRVIDDEQRLPPHSTPPGL